MINDAQLSFVLKCKIAISGQTDKPCKQNTTEQSECKW